MSASNFMQAWVALTGSLAMIAIILTALGLMVGVVKPADAARHLGAILGMVIVLMFAPGLVMSAWSGLSPWQQIGLIAIGIGVFSWLRPRHQPRKRKGE
jgi:hypothetical protein